MNFSSFEGDYFWLNTIISIFLTLIVYSLPIIIYRYAIRRKPVNPGTAKKITIIYAVIAFIAMFFILLFLGNGAPGGAVVLWSFINYKILTSDYEEAAEEKEPSEEEQPEEEKAVENDTSEPSADASERTVYKVKVSKSKTEVSKSTLKTTNDEEKVKRKLSTKAKIIIASVLALIIFASAEVITIYVMNDKIKSETDISFEKGREQGNASGYAKGYSEGVQEGKSEEGQRAYKKGLDKGYEEGYNTGYSDGEHGYYYDNTSPFTGWRAVYTLK